MTINKLVQPANWNTSSMPMIHSRFAHLVSFQTSDSFWNQTMNTFVSPWTWRLSLKMKIIWHLWRGYTCHCSQKRTTLKFRFDMSTWIQLSLKMSHHSAVSWFHRTRLLILGSNCRATTVSEVDEWTVSSLGRATELFELFLTAFFTATS